MLSVGTCRSCCSFGDPHWASFGLWLLFPKGLRWWSSISAAARVPPEGSLHQSNGSVAIHRAGAFVGSETSFRAELLDTTTFFLVDEKPPVGAAAHRTLTCSPKHAEQWVGFPVHLLFLHAHVTQGPCCWRPRLVWTGFETLPAGQSFIKHGAIERIMPIWSLQDLEKAAHLYPGVDQTKVQELFDMWGGSVRWVLARGNSPTNKEVLTGAIARTDLPALKLAVCRGGAAMEVRSQSNQHSVFL